MFNSGYIKSKIDENDIILDSRFEKSSNIPIEYNFAKFLNILPKNQGNSQKCVPYSISTIIEINKKLDGNEYYLSIDDIYDNRNPKTDGMQIKDALNYIKNTGYCSTNDDNREQILSYGRLNSYLAIKNSVFMNGPCIMALPVYDIDRVDFWNGYNFQGGHAITCVGYNEEGLILLNSWGSSFGNNGFCVLPYTECNKILECWAIII
jgi:hypothetical protein